MIRIMAARSEHRFTWSHHGVFLYDRDYDWPGGGDEYVEGADGEPFGRSASGAVVFVGTGGEVFESIGAPLAVEILDAPPELEDAATSIGEFDLPLPSGTLVVEPSGGGAGETEIVLRAGSWRARWSGFAEETAEEGPRSAAQKAADHYLLQLWPAAGPGELRCFRALCG